MAVENPFDLINSILERKTPETDLSKYSPFLTNKALSQQADTLPYAAMMNMYGKLPPEMQYAFLFSSIRKVKRPRNKWLKAEKNEDVELISKYYHCSIKKAEQMLRIHTKEQLKQMKATMSEGGEKKTK